MHEFNMHTLDIKYITMTEYDATYKDVGIIFGTENIKNTLGEVISKNGLMQIRAAETEKYPHVTFFFSGGREEPFPGEKRIMIASPQVATYDLQPEMSAVELSRAILSEIEKAECEFMCVNFANPDMVGHTGDFDAIVKAVETVDQCVQSLVENGRKKDYQFIIIADHGNADEARNEDGTPNTAHSKNPVPCFIISRDCNKVSNGGVLADIAPTVLKLLGIPQPGEMSGKALC
jgi:2,3-bisphosphoglycerate-independent phosphoglycerate mutase